MLTSIAQNVRQALRALLRQPTVTTIVVLTLALGIGANTAIFSVVNAVMLRPLPFEDGERFVHLWSRDPANPAKQRVSYPDFADWRSQSRTFERMAAWTVIDGMTLLGGGEPERIDGAAVFGDLFQMLGVPPALGTVLGSESGPTDAAAVLSYGLWQRSFNADPGVVGRDITLQGERLQVIGVMPRDFRFPVDARVEVWARVQAFLRKGSPYLRRDFRGLDVMGLRRPSATVGQAQSEMDIIASELGRQYREDKGFGVQLVPELENLVGDVRRPLAILFAAVGAVLLIACANIANLLLAKSVGRMSEMAVRCALGASRLRVYAQLMTESLLLSVMGGIAGALLAEWMLKSLIVLAPRTLPRVDAIALDTRVLGFTLIVSVLAGLLFGLVPGWYASRVDLNVGLHDATRTVAEPARRRPVRSALVVAEIGMALVLLATAGLLLNSFWRLRGLHSGIDRRNVASFMMNLPYAESARLTDFARRLQERVQAIPGVRAASVFTGRPAALGITFDIEGRPRTDHEAVDLLTVQPGFMTTLSVPLIAGRDFLQSDDGTAPPVVIISETLARRYFRDENPLGHRLGVRLQMTSRVFPPKEIVGVVGDVRLERELRPQIYFPAAQDPRVLAYFSFVVKTNSHPMSVGPSLRSAVLSIDREQPLYQLSTLEQQAEESIAQDRFNALLLAIFAGLALVLTASGLYGVLSYTVAQRTSEIGIRVALGAHPRDVLRLVMRDGVKLTGIGLMIGLLGAFAATRLIAGLLFGVSAADPFTLLLATLLLVIVAILACWIPARRATRVDPVVALRCR